MNNLKKALPIHVISFASTRYFPDQEVLDQSILQIQDSLSSSFANNDASAQLLFRQVTSEEELKAVEESEAMDFAVFIIMSGAVQPWVLKAAKKVKSVGLLASYVKGVFDDSLSDVLLEKNAAPAIMDIYAVLKKEHGGVHWLENIDQCRRLWRSSQAIYRLNGSKLLLVGQTEPWVISASRDYNKVKERFGIDVEVVPLEDVYAMYRSLSDQEAEATAQRWIQNAEQIVEPNEKEVFDAGKLVVAIEKLLEAKEADGLAIACFELLGNLKTTSCLALSHLNDLDNFIGACEGDTDSAITMLLVKALTGKASWMANPNVQNDGSVNFVHCSAPMSLSQAKPQYQLRNHHESGIGVSTEMELIPSSTLTLTRIGNDLNTITVQKGIAMDPVKEKSCRTQLKIKPESIEKYLNDVLGCHQVIVFEDIKEDLVLTGKLLGLEVLA